MKKLIQIQSELKCPKNQFNSFGKYYFRNTEGILEALKPLLLKHGCLLTITDEVKQIGDVLYIEATVRYNEDDKTIDVKAQAGVDINTKGMSLAQCFGASSSYARKYALNGLFAIDDTKDADATNDHKETKLPELSPKSNKWNKAVEYCASKGVSGIVKKYYLSEENMTLLLNQALELTEEATKAERNGL
jgi:hypothetical protein